MQLANLQKKYNILSNELMKTKQENSSFYDSFGNYDNKLIQYKKNLCDANKEIERLNKVINVIEIDLNNAEEAQKEKNNKIEQLTNEINNLKKELLNNNNKNNLNEDNNNIKENEIKNNLDIEKKYIEKYNEMKAEISNLQKVISQLGSAN